jgi:hypothetical protein
MSKTQNWPHVKIPRLPYPGAAKPAKEKRRAKRLGVAFPPAPASKNVDPKRSNRISFIILAPSVTAAGMGVDRLKFIRPW